MTELFDWIRSHDVLLTWLAVGSVVMFFGSLLLVPWIVVRIPADYFAESARGHRRWEQFPRPLRWLLTLGKNALGIVFVVAGLAMLLLPGQGLLTIVFGLLLLDFPGKFQLERWLITWRPVRRSVDYLRERAGRDPLIIDHEGEAETGEARADSDRVAAEQDEGDAEQDQRDTESPAAVPPPEKTSPATSPHVLRGRLLIVVAAAMWSTSGFFAKSTVFDSWPLEDDGPIPVRGTMLAFWRAVFAGLVILPFMRRPCWRLGLVPMSISFLLMNMTYLPAMTLTTAANAIWLQNTAPIWVYLFGALVLRDRIGPRDWLLLLLCMSGVGVILGFETSANGAAGTSLKGVGLGVLSGLFYAGILISLRGLRSVNSAWLMVVCHGVTAAALLPMMLSWKIMPEGQQWAYLIALGVFQMGVPYLLFAQGLRDVVGHEAVGLVLLEPVLVPVWVWVAYHGTASYDRPDWWTLVGAALILSGLLVRYFGVIRSRAAGR